MITTHRNVNSRFLMYFFSLFSLPLWFLRFKNTVRFFLLILCSFHHHRHDREVFQGEEKKTTNILSFFSPTYVSFVAETITGKRRYHRRIAIAFDLRWIKYRIYLAHRHSPTHNNTFTMNRFPIKWDTFTFTSVQQAQRNRQENRSIVILICFPFSGNILSIEYSNDACTQNLSILILTARDGQVYISRDRMSEEERETERVQCRTEYWDGITSVN